MASRSLSSGGFLPALFKGCRVLGSGSRICGLCVGAYKVSEVVIKELLWIRNFVEAGFRNQCVGASGSD